MSIKKPKSADSEVLEIMHSITHLYRSQQFRSLQGDAKELGPVEFRVLAFIARHPGCTQSDLAAHSGRDKGQLARLLRGLRDAGLVLAETDAVDRRSTLLTLSEAGEALFKEVHVQGEQVARQGLAGFSAQERELLDSLLQRVRDNLAAGN